MTDLQTEEIAELYRELAHTSQPTSAFIRTCNGQYTVVNTQWSQRDIEKAEKSTFTKNYILNASDNSVLLNIPAQEASNEIWNKDSPSGNLQAILRSWKDKKSEEKQFIEIWNSYGKLKNFDVLSQEKHNKINNSDLNFGSFQWSYSEDKILYVAERKLPKQASFFGKSNKDEEDKKDETLKGHQHDALEDWGEQLTKKSCPVICIIDISTGDIEVLETPQQLSCGQVVWSPGDKGVVFVGWDNDPFRLGLKYCTQRKSGIYYYDIESKETKLLSDETHAVRSPNFSPDQSKLIYMDHPVGGAHKQCARIMMIDWKSKSKQVVVDIVNDIKGSEFCGVYSDEFSQRCWSDDSTYVIINSFSRSQVALFAINVITKKIQHIPVENHRGSIGVLDVHKNKVILSCSSPNTPHFLMIGDVDFNKLGDKVQWKRMYEEKTYDEITFDVQVLQPSKERVNSKYDSLLYESVLVAPKGIQNKKPPLIVFPHGGPHVTFDTSFMLYVAGFVKCGYAVLLVNYRGSLGFGQDSVLSLLGNIGDQDVKDVKAAADNIISQDLVDKEEIFVFGGSHGGFLTTHLIGQYPGFFKGAVCRNPVTNLTVMSGISDIPDWVWTEVGLDYTHASSLDVKTCEQMYNRSPIRYIDQVKTPLLLMIGKDDLRVPPAQAREYYRGLKARKIPTRLIEYEDNSHPIVKVDSEADAFVNIMLWFNSCRK